MSTEPTTQFSTSGDDAITRSIDVKPDTTAHELASPEEFDRFYDIDRTVDEIIKNDYKRIALQFPDELLHDSVPIYRRLKKNLDAQSPARKCELYVLADTSYGSCCVDEVAAQHANADAMVHYGHACMSQTSRLPVIYVFGRKPLDVADCVSKLIAEYQACSPNEQDHVEVLFRHDVVYTHIAESILQKLRESLPKCNVSYTPLPWKTLPEGQTNAASIPAADDSQPTPVPTLIFYVGSESLTLTNLLITNFQAQVIAYDPTTQRATLQSTKTNKMLMKRYAAVQKARDADVFGILVGTLGVASYLPLVNHLRTLLTKRAHKKTYTISVGKLNPAKLANFMEIECFVLVACPENSLLDYVGAGGGVGSAEFWRPIVTPFEVEIALGMNAVDTGDGAGGKKMGRIAKEGWTGRYVLDFKKVLEEGASVDDEKGEEKQEGKERDEEEEDVDEDRPQFSLVTGKYRQAKRYGGSSNQDASTTKDQNQTTSSDLVARNQESTLAIPHSAAAEFLNQRSYQGLEQRIGEDEPSVLEQGRSGIARGYSDDHRPTSSQQTED